MLNPPSTFVYFRWSWYCYFGLVLVSSGLGLVTLVLVLRIWSCLHHWVNYCGVYGCWLQGACVIWYNLLKNGDGDVSTRHAACPVLVGSKWGTSNPITYIAI